MTLVLVCLFIFGNAEIDRRQVQEASMIALPAVPDSLFEEEPDPIQPDSVLVDSLQVHKSVEESLKMLEIIPEIIKRDSLRNLKYGFRFAVLRETTYVLIE